MRTRGLVCALLATATLALAGCADPVEPPVDGGVPTDAAPEDAAPADAGVPEDAGPAEDASAPDDAGTPGQGRLRPLGLGPGGGTATSTSYRVTGEIGRPTSTGRSMGPDHTIVGGVGRPARP